MILRIESVNKQNLAKVKLYYPLYISKYCLVNVELNKRNKGLKGRKRRCKIIVNSFLFLATRPDSVLQALSLPTKIRETVERFPKLYKKLRLKVRVGFAATLSL